MAAYVADLPHEQATPSIEKGDPERGERLYVTCGQCHGNLAQGNATMRAPQLSGQSDWYLVRQLYNFKHRDSWCAS
ncbi:MAG: c-type cytochrome [Gammaproteobacteria bacterium]|nr:c-type cytochrome [Gammaproteobacteria bacterium]